MKTADIIAQEEACLIPTYRKMPLALVRGEGSYVWDADGRRFLDFYGGHCVTVLGHCPARVTQALKRQADTMLFYSNVVYSDMRARAASRLARMAPPGLDWIFFCNSGTEAVETALKLARKATGRMRVLSMEGDFHGRTLGSLATTWNPAYREPYRPLLGGTQFVPFGDLDAARHAVDDSVAAVVLEPIQSIAGMVEADPEYYRALRELTREQGCMLIFDEVQTGVGRTGTFSVSEQYGMRPDIITLAKSLGSGVPVGAVLTAADIAETVQYGDHGSTFGGGMMAMAALEATLATIEEESLMQRAAVIYDAIARELSPGSASVRGRGCLMGIELREPAAGVLAALRERSVLAGSSQDSHVIRVLPPLTATPRDVEFFLTALRSILA